jgi:16S rRNA (uracil1498-N3)-methyltransferase
MHIFYSPEAKTDFFFFDADESRHCVKVLRLKAGSRINVVDGKGGWYECELVDENHKKTWLKTLHYSSGYKKTDFNIHIAIAPTKNMDRLETFCEKATEIGIDSITFFISEHSERKIVKPERIQRILISAMKQSQKAYLPTLNPVTSFNELIKNNLEKHKYIAHCTEDSVNYLPDIYEAGQDVFVLIGPEGDFSSEEIREAHRAGFTSVSLGESRLRTETAGIVACQMLNHINFKAKIKK